MFLSKTVIRGVNGLSWPWRMTSLHVLSQAHDRSMTVCVRFFWILEKTRWARVAIHTAEFDKNTERITYILKYNEKITTDSSVNIGKNTHIYMYMYVTYMYCLVEIWAKIRQLISITIIIAQNPFRNILNKTTGMHDVIRAKDERKWGG